MYKFYDASQHGYDVLMAIRRTFNDRGIYKSRAVARDDNLFSARIVKRSNLLGFFFFGRWGRGGRTVIHPITYTRYLARAGAPRKRRDIIRRRLKSPYIRGDANGVNIAHKSDDLDRRGYSLFRNNVL